MSRKSPRPFIDLHPNFQNEPEQYNEFARGFKPSEFAKLQKVHVNTVYRWILDGQIKAKRIKIYERHRYIVSCFAANPHLKSGPVPKPSED